MAGAFERIEQEMAALDKRLVTITQEFQDTYHHYLAELGRAVRQQLILAGYHVCTKGYPERFLKLSFNQRQQLQQSFRELAQQAQTQLKQLPEVTAARESAEGLLEGVQPFEETDALDDLEDEDAPEASGLLSTDDRLVLEPITLIEEALADMEQPTPLEQLEQWQADLESGITELLQTLSHGANRLLQRSAILSDKLPEPVLEVAAKADFSAEAISGPPNLLNLLIESDENASEGSSVTHIIAIHLRLSEIEFSSPAVSTWRTKIRELSSQLGRLGREYQKKQRDRAIAEAEAAWRSSWYDE